MNTVRWRKTWFQVHKWIGLCLAILIIPLSLSGAALVWREPLDRLLNAERYRTTGTALLAPATYAAAAQRVLGAGDRIAEIALPEGAGPVVVSAVGTGASRRGPPPRTGVYLDPPTARVLAVAPRSGGVLRFLHVLHGSLQLPGIGRTIVGWIGVAMLLSSMTGLWLWWPSVGRWTKGFRWRRHRNTDSNLHYQMGFWIALPLFVLSLTGVWISFPGVFGGREGGGRPAFAAPVADPAQSIDTVVARAAAVAKGPLRSVAWPTEKSADWTVALADGRRIKVADDGGVAVAAAARKPGGVARWMRRIHDGDDMGIVWQVVIFLGGVLPAALAVTGVIMWWRARGWRAKLAARG